LTAKRQALDKEINKMKVKDLKELWNSNKEVRIYCDNGDLFLGDLQDLDDVKILNMSIEGIYDGIYYENRNDIDIWVI